MSSHTLLIVDDNPSDQMISSGVVESLMFTPIVASNGFAAIELLNEMDFKMMVVDLQMPQMGGIEFIKRVRANHAFREIPILVMSARKEAKDVKIAIQTGAQDYIVKPLDIQILEEKINRLCGKSEGWKEYEISSESMDSQIFIFREDRLVSLSEVGATLETSSAYSEGDIIEIQFSFLMQNQSIVSFNIERGERVGHIRAASEVPLQEEISQRKGIPQRIKAKVIQCEAFNDSYLTKINYIAGDENFRSQLRAYCLDLWRQSQKAKAG